MVIPSKYLIDTSVQLTEQFLILRFMTPEALLYFMLLYVHITVAVIGQNGSMLPFYLKNKWRNVFTNVIVKDYLNLIVFLVFLHQILAYS